MAEIIGSGLELYIKRNARDQALNRRAEAERRAKEIVDQAKERIEIMERDCQAGTRTRISQQKKRLLAQAELQAKQIILSRREAEMESVWQSVASALQRPMAADRRATHLWNALSDAVEQLGGGDLELQGNADDMTLMTEELLAQWQSRLEDRGVTGLTLAHDPAKIRGGLIVRAPRARQMVDNSWDERLTLARQTLRSMVYSRLTADSEA